MTSLPDELGRFLTLADVAEVLNISPRQAFDLVRTGELPAIRVGDGGPWRVEKTVFETYIDAMYEEARLSNMWRQAEFADVAEPAFGEPRRR